MQQLSLFPDGFEMYERALTSLRALEFPAARDRVQEARRLGVASVDLDAVAAAVDWLQPRCTGAAAAAGAVAQVAPAVLARELTVAAAGVADAALAHFLAPRRSGALFLDDGERVPHALIDLLRGDVAVARSGFEALLVAGHGDRGDVLGYHGDACALEQRGADANASFVRALVLAPQAFDVVRLREPRLRARFAALAEQHPVKVAAELLFVEAWIAGELSVPPRATFVSPRQAARLLATTRSAPSWRMSVLAYLDRSAAPGDVDVARREEMAALEPTLFARFIGAVRAREG